MESQGNHKAASNSPVSSLSPAMVGWGIAAIIVSFVVLTFNTSPMVLGASFFAKLLAGLLGSVFGVVGALLGDMLRRFVHPDMVFTSGGFFSLLGIKLFWLVGPQLIGLGIGVALGCALVLG
ncbi:hypothetical protein [Halomonas sp. IOP_31]|uniref:hypothetical protein n=1 Tax=Halomonas sp. IOP_31 TaxID=2876584 RepID=UPI001E3CD958|nr:hypothetical protein [Halomonas sp. IOP_31]MCD6010091.1 hypothetical protein [Halomonas sp. IOP_31]